MIPTPADAIRLRALIAAIARIGALLLLIEPVAACVALLADWADQSGWYYGWAAIASTIARVALAGLILLFARPLAALIVPLHTAPVCPSCGYGLVGLGDAPRCPECGLVLPAEYQHLTDADLAQAVQAAARRQRLGGAILNWTGFGLLIGAAVLVLAGLANWLGGDGGPVIAIIALGGALCLASLLFVRLGAARVRQADRLGRHSDSEPTEAES